MRNRPPCVLQPVTGRGPCVLDPLVEIRIYGISEPAPVVETRCEGETGFCDHRWRDLRFYLFPKALRVRQCEVCLRLDRRWGRGRWQRG